MKDKELYVSPTCEPFGLQMELLATGSAEGINWGGDYNNSPLNMDPLSLPELPGLTGMPGSL